MTGAWPWPEQHVGGDGSPAGRTRPPGRLTPVEEYSARIALRILLSGTDHRRRDPWWGPSPACWLQRERVSPEVSLPPPVLLCFPRQRSLSPLHRKAWPKGASLFWRRSTAR